MADLKIDRLSLRFENAGAHEHRLRAIAARAAALLGERLSERMDGAIDQLGALDRPTSAVPLRINLDLLSDDQAAGRIADAWMTALDGLNLRIGVSAEEA